MEKILIIRPTESQCIERIDVLAEKYGASDWMTLYHDSVAMSDEDRDEFEFLCDAYWSELIERAVKSDSPPGEDSGIEMNASQEPGFNPGFAVFRAVIAVASSRISGDDRALSRLLPPSGGAPAPACASTSVPRQHKAPLERYDPFLGRPRPHGQRTRDF